jgi:hypothetical protein
MRVRTGGVEMRDVPGVDIGDAGGRALAVNACLAARMTWSAVPVSRASGRHSRLGETDRMRCPHGSLDAVAASGTPNPGKVATSGTPAVCTVNEPADQQRPCAWPCIRWKGLPEAKAAAATGIQVRLSWAAHYGGNASRRG